MRNLQRRVATTLSALILLAGVGLFVANAAAATATYAAGKAATNLPTETRWPGAQNPPYICCWNQQGQYVKFSFTTPAVSTTLRLRYSAGNGDASRKVERDGTVIAANQTFARTADWNTWATLTLAAHTMTSGTHTLKVWFDAPAGSHQFINLDNLTVTTGTTTTTTGPPPPPPPPNGTGDPRPVVGILAERNVAALTHFESWLGRQVKYIIEMGDASSANNFMSSVWGEVKCDNASYCQPLHNFATVANRVRFVLSVPLVFNYQFASPTSVRCPALQATANGQNDGAYNYAASILKDPYPSAIIRLGWELDGDWMPWSAVGCESQYQAAFRHVHDLFRAQSAGFTFDYNGDPAQLGEAKAVYPPLASYVNIVSVDAYDGPTNTSNLAAWKAWAISVGKPIAVPEWGTARDSTSYVQMMWDWMRALPASGPGSLAYATYFDTNNGQEFHLDYGQNPNAAARFRSLFR